MRRDQKVLLAVALTSVALWAVPGLNFLIVPLTYLNTHLHELCHALAAMATGGAVQHILVHADGSGVTPVAGGALFAVASAGYVGTSVIGGACVLAASSSRGAKSLMLGLAVAFGLSLLLFVRGDLVGIASGFVWAVGFASVWHKGSADVQRWVGQFVGVQLCLTSLQSFSFLFQASAMPGVASDATNMQEATGIPAMFWAALWATVALLTVGATLKAAWRNRPGPEA